MTGATIIFYLLAVMTLVSAVLSVTTRRIFRAAIYLLFSLIGVAGIYFWLDYQFVGAVQIVVYVGGIVVLIIFSIFLTQAAGEKMPRQRTGRSLLAAIVSAAALGLILVEIGRHRFRIPEEQGAPVTVRTIGNQMLSTGEAGYALPFEVISILLLAAMIGCIVIAMRSPAGESEKRDMQAGPDKAEKL